MFLGSICVTDASRDGPELEEEAVQGSSPRRRPCTPPRTSCCRSGSSCRCSSLRTRARAAAHPGGANCDAGGMAGGVKALLARTRREADGEEVKTEQSLRGLTGAPGDDGWSADGLKRAASWMSTLRMKLEDAEDEAFVHRARAGLVRRSPRGCSAGCGRRQEASLRDLPRAIQWAVTN
ncbi:LOW QUALITY PROTEIN: hypothetical protein U9M48_036799 [Paspalum notatum var. saurae]|uniref:Uncharacterized protein n=1 Tax=Paspalum notatum var. saurae TaxID=547442 RepID=A0AAQ3X8M0_PASNO